MEGAEHEAELAALGVVIEHVGKGPHFILDGRAMRRRVEELGAEREFDMVIGWNQEFSSLTGPLRGRVPTGAIAAGQYFDLLRPRLRDLRRPRAVWRCMVLRTMLRRTYRGAETVFAISEYLRGVVIDVFGCKPENVVVAYWGVNPIFAKAERKPAGAIKNLFFYGSSAPRKGIPDTMAALGRLYAQGVRDWTLKLIAWDRELVGKLAREHGIEDRVVPLDPMSHEALVAELEWAQLAILPSRYESFGLACAECQTSGLPVIAYDVGGVEEVVLQGETGWLVPLDSVDGLVDAVRCARRSGTSRSPTPMAR